MNTTSEVPKTHYKNPRKQVCPCCKKQFLTFPSSKKKYCSPLCYHRNKQKPLKKYVCSTCKKEFYRKEAHVRVNLKKSWNLYCSRKCQRFYPHPIVLYCKSCGEEFKKFPSDIKNGRGKYCSSRCRNEEQKLNGRWSKGYDKCVQCGTTSIKHGAFGVCKHCYDFRHDIKKRYGINPEEYDKLIKECEICGEKQNLTIDHDHKTGKFRGILCRHCNYGIGFMHDSILLLENAIRYIKDKKK